MALTYDPTGHPLLSEKAQDLPVTSLVAHGELAEELLGLRGVSLNEDDTEAARLAIVQQVNLQVRMPTDFGLIIEEQKGDQRVKYRGPEGASMAPIDPTAEKIVAGLLGGGNWATLRSLR